MKLVNHLVIIFHFHIGIGTSKYSGMPSTDHLIFELQIRLRIHILNFTQPVLLLLLLVCITVGLLNSFFFLYTYKHILHTTTII